MKPTDDLHWTGWVILGVLCLAVAGISVGMLLFILTLIGLVS